MNVNRIILIIGIILIVSSFLLMAYQFKTIGKDAFNCVKDPKSYYLNHSVNYVIGAYNPILNMELNLSNVNITSE